MSHRMTSTELFGSNWRDWPERDKKRLLLKLRQQSQDLEQRPRTKPALPFRKWALDYLGSYFPDPPSQFHAWLSTELGTLHHRRGSRLNVLAPRGAAKSTWSTFAYPLYCALHGLE